MGKLYTIFFVFISLCSPAQQQGNTWYFGEHSGLDFSGSMPVVLSDGQTGSDIASYESQEGTSVISDNSGKLLFYTSGKTIWDSDHSPMPNGTGIYGGISSTQSSIIVPLPGSNSIFYVFTSDEFQNYTSSQEYGYRYCIVNMCLNAGKGDVIAGKKNILLLDSSTEKLSACEDADARGYWIMGHKMFSDEFCAWHLTSSGISDTVVSHIGTVHGWDAIHASWNSGAAQGQMKFNPAGNKLALVIGNADPGILDLFDFNINTGIVSNFQHIVVDSALHKSVYGVEFSPDGSKCYATVSGGSGGKRIYQYDLTAGNGNVSSIIASRITLFQSNSNSVMFGMQLGADNKIYVVDDEYNDLGRINTPNLAGSSADFDSVVITLTGTNHYTLPGFIAGYKYHNTNLPDTAAVSISASPSTNICSGLPVTFTAHTINTGTTTYQWKKNGIIVNSDSAIYTDSGLINNDTITCIITIAGCSINSTAASNPLIIAISPSAPRLITARRDTICSGTSCNLTVTGNAANIEWQSGTTPGSFMPIPGANGTTYTGVLNQSANFRVVNYGTCPDTSDTYKIFVPPVLIAKFTDAQTALKQLTFSSDSSSGTIVSYHWDFGDGQTSDQQNPTHTFPKDTTYYICLTLYDGSNCSYTYCGYSSIADDVINPAGQNDWVVFPNPVNSSFNIYNQGKDKVERLKIFDVLGRILMDEEMNSSMPATQQINVSALACGMYYLSIETKEKNYIQPLIKQ